MIEQHYFLSNLIPNLTRIKKKIEPDNILLGINFKLPEIKKGASSYNVENDTIYLPLKSDFYSEYEYYRNLFHELAHSTAHPKRLNRSFGVVFGDHQYCIEEIIAEITSVILCAKSGILQHTADTSSRYLYNWYIVLYSYYYQRTDTQVLPYCLKKASEIINYLKV